MSAKNTTPKLFEGFSPQSKEEWKSVIKGDLKDADFEKKLVWKTYDGYAVEPYYTEDDLDDLTILDSRPAEFPYIRGTKSDNIWKITEDINVPSTEEANKLAIDGLNKGLSALTFVCNVKTNKINGVAIQNQNDLSRLLNDIPIDKFPIRFVCGSASLPILGMIINEARSRGVPLEKLNVSLETDPLSQLLANGVLEQDRFSTFRELKTSLEFIDENMPSAKGLCVHSHCFHDAGSSATEELAFTLAAGVEYLSELTSMDVGVDAVAGHMAFSFSIGTSYFTEIAKLRAARLLWAKIVEQFDPATEDSSKMVIYAKGSTRSQTMYDPYVNMLRGATQTMSAAIAGADHISIPPFDEVFKTPHEFSRRVARNTQLVLKHESYLDKVIDPSAGSYYIENLTQLTVENSWKLFLEIESRGGLIESLKSSFVQEEINRVRSVKDKNIATRKDTLLGTNQFPILSEKIRGENSTPQNSTPLTYSAANLNKDIIENIEQISEAIKSDGVSIGDILTLGANKPKVKPDFEIVPVSPYRASESFEELRLATESFTAKTGNTPRVFLLTIGDLAMRMARANFSLNFFGCAGFDVIDNLGLETVDQGVEAASESGAEIVVICSSDQEYASVAPEICKKIKSANPNIFVIVAGLPKDIAYELKASGIDDFIHARTNAVELLSKYQKLLNING